MTSASQLVTSLRERRALRWLRRVAKLGVCPGDLARKCEHCARQLDVLRGDAAVLEIEFVQPPLTRRPSRRR